MSSAQKEPYRTDQPDHSGPSKSARKVPACDASIETVRRAQHYEDEQSMISRLGINDDSGATQSGSSAAKASSSNTNTCPREIQDDLDAVQAFARAFMKTPCQSCGTQLLQGFSTETCVQTWAKAFRSGEKPLLSSATCPRNKCRSSTCLGCGKEPSSAKKGHIVDGYKLDWCCWEGRLFSVWVLLCSYDGIELAVQSQATSGTKATGGRDGHKDSLSKGTGYGGSQRTLCPMPYATRFDRFGYPVMQAVMDFKKTDDQTDDTTQTLFRLVTELLPLRERQSSPEGLCEMIELSLFQDRAAQLLRNDSLTDISKRGKLYHSLLAFVAKIGTYKHTRFLVTDARFAKKRSPGLVVLSSGDSDQEQNRNTSVRGKGKVVSEEAQLLEVERSKDAMTLSLFQSMENLYKQSSALIKASKVSKKGFTGASGQDMLALARHVTQVYDILKPEIVEDIISRSEGTKSSSTSWAEYNAANRVEYTSGVMASMRFQLMAQYIRESPRQRLRKITMELADMTTSLPDNIFVKAQEERPDVMKCLIIGPGDTPYEGGIFESVPEMPNTTPKLTSTRFDILCDKEYPHEPPKVAFLTHNKGRVRFNPNLHRDGKVCLSLLGTWPGRPEEQWQPGQSTILQVLVSIQAMILNDEPFRNEPGFEDVRGWDAQRYSQKYNQRVQAFTVRFALLDWLSRSNVHRSIWEDVVEKYFQFNGNRILSTVQKWASTNPEIEQYTLMDGRGYSEGGEFSSLGRPKFANLLSDLQAALIQGQ
ncbi:hypothetical protein MMC27_008508 [Xylographa pallens]|nr:hypothetical protein [Xylographa pallens]